MTLSLSQSVLEPRRMLYLRRVGFIFMHVHPLSKSNEILFLLFCLFFPIPLFFFHVIQSFVSGIRHHSYLLLSPFVYIVDLLE